MSTPIAYSPTCKALYSIYCSD